METAGNTKLTLIISRKNRIVLHIYPYGTRAQSTLESSAKQLYSSLEGKSNHRSAHSVIDTPSPRPPPSLFSQSHRAVTNWIRSDLYLRIATHRALASPFLLS